MQQKVHRNDEYGGQNQAGQIAMDRRFGVETEHRHAGERCAGQVMEEGSQSGHSGLAGGTLIECLP